jgi:hypothetical protein
MATFPLRWHRERRIVRRSRHTGPNPRPGSTPHWSSRSSEMPPALGIPELVDRIIDHLHDEFDALKTCGQVCQFWIPASRYHLFHSVTLTHANASGFLKLLKSRHATFVEHVRYLRVHEGGWIQELVRLASVHRLALYTNVGFAIDSARGNFQVVTWLELQDITFPTFGDLASFICSFPLLRQIRLSSVGWSAESTDIPPPGHLQTLALSGRVPKAAILSWLCSRHDLSITMLDLESIGQHEASIVGRFICTLRRLSSLSLSFSNDLEQHPGIVSPQFLLQLSY